MSTDDSLGTRYDVRRQARGMEPPDGKDAWWRRLILPGVVVLALGLLVGGYFTYSAIVYVKAVRAELSTDTRNVTPPVRARVIELPVQEGDAVSKGDLVARLEDSRQRTALERAQKMVEERQSQLAQAKTNLARVNRRVKAAVERARLAVQMAKAGVASTRAALESRKVAVTGQLAEAGAQCEKGKAQLAKLKKGPREEDILSAEARLASARAQLALYELEVQQSEELVGEGIDSEHILEVRKTRLKQQRSAVREAELALQRMKNGPTPEEMEIARQEVLAREAAVEVARAGQKDIERLQAELEARKAELAEAEAALQEAEAAREEEVELARARKNAAESALGHAKEAAKDARLAVEERHLRARVDGVVTRVFWDVGERAAADTPLAIIQAKGGDFYVDAWVSERDAPLLKTGQKAWIEVLAGNQGDVEGEVTQVSYHTASQEAGGQSERPAAGQTVWCKIVPREPLEEGLKDGMTVRALIRVR